MSQISYGSITITDATDGVQSAIIYLYRNSDEGTDTAPSVPSNELTYTFSTGRLSGTLNGWQQSTSGLDTSKTIWLITAMALSSDTTDKIKSTEWSQPRPFSQTAGQDGKDGLNQATVFIYKRGTDIQTPTGGQTYNFENPKQFEPPNGWHTTIPASNINKDPCYVSAAAVFSRDITTQIQEWAEPTILVQDGEDGEDGAPGTSYYTHIRYATDSNGANMSDSPTGKTYIGIYTGTSERAPTTPSSYAPWSEYVGHQGDPGTSVTGTKPIYFLTTSQASSPPALVNGTQINETNPVAGVWTTAIPTYIVGEKYYTSVQTTFNGGTTPKYSPIVLNQGLTDSNYNAALAKSIAQSSEENSIGALSIARGVRQHFFWFPTDVSDKVPAGSYIAEENEDTFKAGPTKGNLLTRSDGIWIRHGAKVLAALQGGGLTFFVPDGNLQGNPGIQLTNSALKFYRPGTDTIDATLDSKGLVLSKGGVTAGSPSTNNFVYLNSEPYGTTYNINGSSNVSDWKEIIGTKFGVRADGTLYANGAIITGKIEASSGSNILTSVSSKVQYNLSSSTSTADGTWSDTVPTWSNNKYIWTRVATTKTTPDGSTTTYSTAVYDRALTSALSTATSAQGLANGAASTVTTTREYNLSSSTSTADGTWSTTVPTWSKNKYIWIRLKIVKKTVGGTTTTSYTPSEAGSYDSALTTALSTAEAAQSAATTANNKTFTFRGTSATSASTATKVVSCTGWTLTDGATIVITWKSNSSLTTGQVNLNINSTGEKPIYIQGAITSDTNRLQWLYGASITFRYNSSGYYEIVDQPPTYYGATCSIDAATADKKSVVNQAIIFKGTTVEIPMTYNNTAASPTLALQEGDTTTTASAIYYGTSTTKPTAKNGFSWIADTTVRMVYDGKFWRMGGRTYINGGDILTDTVTADQIKVNNLSALSADMGTLTAGTIKYGTVGSNDSFYLSKSDTSAKIGGQTSAVAGLRLAVGSGFGVTKNGVLYATGAHISGAITATSLSLGTNVSIDSGKVTGLSTVATSGKYSDLSGTPNLTVYIAKDGTVGSTPASGANGFKVSSAGVLTASNAIIYGTIYATAGTIGGFTIENNSIHTNGVAITSNADNSIGLSTADFTRTISNTSRGGLRFALGDKFGVTGDGTVYAGGWIMNASSIYKTSASATAVNQVQVQAGMQGVNGLPTDSTTLAFYVCRRTCTAYSNNTPTYGSWSYPFRVNYDGSLTATKADITGTITATSFTAKRGSASAKNAATLNSNGLTIYNSSGTTIATFNDSISLASNGATVTIGKVATNNYNAYITTTDFQIRNNDAPIATFGNKITLGSSTWTGVSLSTGGFTISKYGDTIVDIATGTGSSLNGITSGIYYILGHYQVGLIGGLEPPPSYEEEGYGFCSLTEGAESYAIGDYSHASGYSIITRGDYQTAIGQFNNNSTSNAFEIGWGTADSARKNIFAVGTNGTVKINETNMNDFVIEQGNGYRKWNSGIAECWVHTAQNVALNNAYGSLYQGTWTWKFPITFNANPAVTCSHFKWGTGGSWGTIGGVSTTAATLRGFDTYSRATGTCDIAAYAIGRWK